MEELIKKLRQIADEMENGEWVDQEAAVLITRDADGMLTFCEWGQSGQLLEQANKTKRAAA